jgi:CHAT domain/SIR2-like domain
MNEYCELEIALTAVDLDIFEVQLRFTNPSSEADNRPDGQKLKIDLDQLALLTAEPIKYGNSLCDMLFQGKVGEAYRCANAAAGNARQKLRIRLLLAASAGRLHSIRWETIADPNDRERRLVMREDVVFSRYLDSRDWRPIAPTRKTTVRALAVISSPKDLAEYDFVVPSVDEELNRIKIAMQSIRLDTLSKQNQAVTVDAIMAKLREPVEGYEIFYLVCHGALINNEPYLYLEDQDGNTVPIPGMELVVRLQDMQRRPQLVVLASCQSAGTGNQASGDNNPLAALGPKLAEHGIPAVLAMHGNVTMKTISQFMPLFFRELLHHGQIDRAVAVARGAVRDRPDWWMPVLFTRLKSGIIWYECGFIAGNDENYRRWDALLGGLQNGKCVIVCGAGLSEFLLGSTREIARSWADNYGYPMAAHEREDLPQVTQYLAYTQSSDFPMLALRNYLKREIEKKYKEVLVAMPAPSNPDGRLDWMITGVGRKLRKENLDDPYRLLASLPISTYISTSRDCLLQDALEDEGRKPEVVICRWREDESDEDDDDKWPTSVFDTEPDFKPSVDRPLIFQVFGSLRYPRSVVLTEDDYFDYLTSVPKNQQNEKLGIPPRILRILATHGLVFLGFHVDDWDFRVLFRGILRRPGGRLGANCANVAVQIEPSEGRMLEPLQARNYLKQYFLLNRKIEAYWGSADDFLKEMSQRWKRYLE